MIFFIQLQQQVWPSLHGYLKRGSHPSTFLPSPFSFVIFRQDTRHSQHAQVGKAPWGKLLRSKFECNCHFVYRVSSLHHSNLKSLIFTVYSCPLRKKFLGVSREKRVHLWLQKRKGWPNVYTCFCLWFLISLNEIQLKERGRRCFEEDTLSKTNDGGELEFLLLNRTIHCTILA